MADFLAGLMDRIRNSINPTTYDTPLAASQQDAFLKWKALNAPNDSGVDYDLPGAYLYDLQGKLPRDSRGHTTDYFKKPNHPTFSVESQYAKQRPDLAGQWGAGTENYIPPAMPMSTSILAVMKKMGIK